MSRNGPNRKASLPRPTSWVNPQYEIIEDSKFSHNGGVARYVKPYVQEFVTYAKGRWYGREIIEVTSTEFGSHPYEYWKYSIEAGHVRINDQKVDIHYKFKNGDQLLHRTHRHEPPIFGQLTLVADTPDIMAVNKPPSWPMHACGAYRFNSLEYVLKYEPLIENQPPPLLVHRLGE